MVTAPRGRSEPQVVKELGSRPPSLNHRLDRESGSDRQNHAPWTRQVDWLQIVRTSRAKVLYACTAVRIIVIRSRPADDDTRCPCATEASLDFQHCLAGCAFYCPCVLTDSAMPKTTTTTTTATTPAATTTTHGRITTHGREAHDLQHRSDHLECS